MKNQMAMMQFPKCSAQMQVRSTCATTVVNDVDIGHLRAESKDEGVISTLQILHADVRADPKPPKEVKPRVFFGNTCEIALHIFYVLMVGCYPTSNKTFTNVNKCEFCVTCLVTVQSLNFACCTVDFFLSFIHDQHHYIYAFTAFQIMCNVDDLIILHACKKRENCRALRLVTNLRIYEVMVCASNHYTYY